jgi:hypothetical protein
VLVLVIPFIEFPVIVFEVAPNGLTRIPLKLPLLADDKLEMMLLFTPMAEPLFTEIAVTTAVAVEETFAIVLLSMVTAVPFDELIAVAMVPLLLEIELILLLDIFLVGHADVSKMA